MPSVRAVDRALVVLLGLALAAAVYRLGAAPLLDDPNEAEYAEVAREMGETHDWLDPRLNGVVFLNKPPLLYWIIAAAQRAVGANELAARLPSAAAGVAVVLLIVRLGGRLYDPTTGLLAGVILLATGGFFVETHLTRPDLLLTASVVGSLDSIARLRAARDRAGRRWPLLELQVALAVGVLAKGLVALALPAAVMGVMMITERRWVWLGRVLHPRAWWLLAVLVVPWHAAMAARHPGFLWDYVVNQHVLFFFDRKLPRDSTPVSLAVFWAALAGRLFPWTLFVPVAVWTAWGGARRHVQDVPSARSDRFVLAWAGTVLIVFSAAGGRMEHYSIPALPAFALLLARAFHGAADAAAPGRGRLVTLHLGIWVLLALAGIVAVPRYVAAQPWLAPVEAYPVIARRVFACLSIAAVAALAAALAQRRRWIAPALAAGAVASLPLVVGGLAGLGRIDSSAPLALAVRALAAPEERLVFQAPVEYQTCAAFDFYLRRPLALLRPAGLDAPPAYLAPHVGRLFITRAQLEAMWQNERVFLITDALPSYAALGAFAPQPFYLVFRDRTRWVVTNRPLH